MSNWQETQDYEAYNERSLKTLSRALTFSSGRFSLILARCNYIWLQAKMQQRLRSHCSIEIRDLVLHGSVKTLFTFIKEQIGEEQPQAVMIWGLESVTALHDLLIATNQVRDEFSKSFAFPLVLWVNDEVLRQVGRLAPDFNSWAGVPIRFMATTEELIHLLCQETETLFAKAMEVGAGRFPHSLDLYAEMDGYRRSDLKAAQQELDSREQKLNPVLTASLQFVFGQDAYINNQMELAQQYYEQSLAFWQQQVSVQKSENLTVPKPQNPLPVPSDPLFYLKRQSCLLFYLGLWWRREAVLDAANHQVACFQARNYYQQCIEGLQTANCSSLAAKFINAWGEVLQQLEEWDNLETVAKTAVKLHQAYSAPIRLAYGYGLLAEVALAKNTWEDAQYYAEQAFQTNELLQKSTQETPYQLDELSWARHHYRSLYLLLIAQSQQHLNLPQKAIDKLEAAKATCNHAYDPMLYTRILETLQALYYQQGKYFTALTTKQEQHSIEQQYRLRAFIGVGRLQPERQVLNPALVSVESPEAIYHTPGQTDLSLHQPMTVAAEIAASGRQHDIDCLKKRLSRTDINLTVLHGPSGVGKSSLITAGLIPELKETSFEARDFVPIVLRVYTDWIKDLGKALVTALKDQGMRYQVSEIEEIEETTNTQLLIQQLRDNADRRKLVTVMIFDQFEEFFFLYPDPIKRRSFLEFLRECLNLPYVKVILSLREDYLHYLLECDRLHLNEITNDILGLKQRYRLGNFSVNDAKLIIERLTERSPFQLEPALIEKLVKDLAQDLEEVRPIELQVVGVQLQDDKITTLAQYQALGEKGENPKEKLVGRFLEQVIKDCGLENKQAANLVLYLLTEEKGTRPLKTLSELITNLSALVDLTVDKEQISLVLKILVKSGLVLLLPEAPPERYQLVHDYLATFIRQKQGNELKQVIAQLEAVKNQQKLTQAALDQTQRQRRRIALLAGIATALGIPATVLAGIAYSQWHQLAIAEVKAITSLSSYQLLSNDQLSALVSSVKASYKLSTIKSLPLETKIQTVSNLLQVSYGTQERQRLKQHSDSVNNASFSPDGKWLASASDDQTVILWKLNGEYSTPFQGHSQRVTSVSFSPNGQQLASASVDGTVILWNLDGHQLKTFKGHHYLATSVSFNPKGEQLASASDDGTVILWKLDGHQLKTFKGHSDRVKAISFSPNGKTLASASWDGTVKLWNLEGKELKTLVHEDGKTVTSINFSPNVKMIASGGWDDPKEIRKRVTSVNFSPDGKMIASGGWDNTIKLWRADGQLLQTLIGHTDRVMSVGFSPDGKTVVSASNDGTVKLWTKDGIELKTLKIKDVNSVTFNPIDGKTLATTSADNTVRLWNLDGIAPKLLHQNTPVTSVSFSPDGMWIASASQSSKILAATAKPIPQSPETPGQLIIWSIDGNKKGKTLPVSGTFTHTKFSPNGQTLASVQELIATDGLQKTAQVQLWQWNNKKLEPKTLPIPGKVSDISFHPDIPILAIAQNIVRQDSQLNAEEPHTESSIKFWSLQGGQPKLFLRYNHEITSISFSPDGKMIASASDDKMVKLWNLDGTLRHTLKGHSATITNISFSPDHTTLASASADNTIKLWRLTDGRELSKLPVQKSPVKSVNFSSDGRMLVSGSDDGTVKIWNTQDGTLLATLKRSDQGVTSVSFRPNGLMMSPASTQNILLIAASQNRSVALWNFELNSLLESSCKWLKDYPAMNKENKDDKLCQDHGMNSRK